MINLLRRTAGVAETAFIFGEPCRQERRTRPCCERTLFVLRTQSISGQTAALNMLRLYIRCKMLSYSSQYVRGSVVMHESPNIVQKTMHAMSQLMNTSLASATPHASAVARSSERRWPATGKALTIRPIMPAVRRRWKTGSSMISPVPTSACIARLHKRAKGERKPNGIGSEGYWRS